MRDWIGWGDQMIYQHSICQIGTFHSNHCEDYVICEPIGQDRLLLAALDGCTMGDESYFASTLFGRLLRKIAKEAFYQEYLLGQQASLFTQLKQVLQRLFTELAAAKNLLQLERNELLTTVLLAIVDTKARQAEIICIGDGVVFCDGQLTEFDQENQPDYLTYHLGTDFEAWYATLEQRMSLAAFSKLALCTDGLLTFVHSEDTRPDPAKTAEVIAYLLQDDAGLDNKRYFQKRLRRIQQDWGFVHTDDLGIVQLRLN